jgi:hypothetical protein
VALVGRRILGAPRFGGVATIAGGSNKVHASVSGGIASTLVEKRASSGCDWLRCKAVQVGGTKRIRNGTNCLAWSDSRNRLVLALGQGVKEKEQEKMNVKVQ